MYLKWTKLWLTKFFPSSIISHVQKVDIAHTRNRNWGLETHKKSGKRPFLWLHVKQILSLKHNTAPGHLIIGMPNKNLHYIHFIKTSQKTTSKTVWLHTFYKDQFKRILVGLFFKQTH